MNNVWTTAVDFCNDEKLNPNGVCVNTIERMLIEEHLNTYRPVVIPLVSEPNK